MEERNITIDIKPSPLKSNLTIITIKGNLDLPNSRYADEKILPLIEKGESNIIIDLSQLYYLSSIGMMSLTQYHALITKKNRSLKLIKPIYDIMTYFGFTKKFEIYESIEEAISSF